ncbi:MAG: ferredoxin-thioredoxin reductase catalytic domain-containing protein [Eubacteriales bacterium]
MDDKIIEEYIDHLQKDVKRSGYNLNPDDEFLHDLAIGLLTNQTRYGYDACPCRLSIGKMEIDMDIICPCDYRDRDLDEYGACYCGLYVSEEIFKGDKQLTPIPDRRRKEKEKNQQVKKFPNGELSYPIWRCKVCGYLCARTAPPEKCPICKVRKERFEKFL